MPFYTGVTPEVRFSSCISYLDVLQHPRLSVSPLSFPPSACWCLLQCSNIGMVSKMFVLYRRGMGRSNVIIWKLSLNGTVSVWLHHCIVCVHSRLTIFIVCSEGACYRKWTWRSVSIIHFLDWISLLSSKRKNYFYLRFTRYPTESDDFTVCEGGLLITLLCEIFGAISKDVRGVLCKDEYLDRMRLMANR